MSTCENAKRAGSADFEKHLETFGEKHQGESWRGPATKAPMLEGKSMQAFPRDLLCVVPSSSRLTLDVWYKAHFRLSCVSREFEN